MSERDRLLMLDLDKATMIGVEIGPFYSPMAPKSEGWRTTVVDFTDTAALRATAATHTAALVRASQGRVEEVDVVWRGDPLDVPCLAIRPEGYDFLIASHVIEHIPDLIKFFAEIDRMLKPNGIISLAVPDMRKCFDVFKSASNTSDVLEAHREKRTKHSPKTLFEALAYAAWVNGHAAWTDSDRTPPKLVNPLAGAMTAYEDYAAGLERGDQAYVDAHAWRFTPASFDMTMLELNALGLIPFVIKTLDPTPGAEFIVRMERGKAVTGHALEAKRNQLIQQRQWESAEALLPRNPAREPSETSEPGSTGLHYW